MTEGLGAFRFFFKYTRYELSYSVVGRKTGGGGGDVKYKKKKVKSYQYAVRAARPNHINRTNSTEPVPALLTVCSSNGLGP